MAEHEMERNARVAASDRESGRVRRDVVEPEVRDVAEERLRVPVVEERVRVEKRLVDLGYIEIRKTVVTEQVMVPVELRREEVEFRRVDAPDGMISSADAPGAFEGSTLRIAVLRERAVVQKEVVVTGEIVVHRDQVFEYVDVVEAVRQERITVDDDDAQARLPHPGAGLVLEAALPPDDVTGEKSGR